VREGPTPVGLFLEGMDFVAPKKTLVPDVTSALRGYLYMRGWAQAQKHKWYPAWRMRAIGSGVPSQKQGS
jgi:hypothetical protein